MEAWEKERLLEADRRYVWHPFTQMKDYESRDHLFIERAEGVFLYDADGKRYYDTISSWWVNVHGHGHPRIREALNRQFQQIDHVLFSGLTHKPGIELAEKLVKLAPDGLSKVFYSDNGSTAVEVALKMSFQYWQQTGKRNKTKFMFVENSYHGDTIGAVSVGGVGAYHSLFQPLLFAAESVQSPDIRAWPDQSEAAEEACVKSALADAEKKLRERAAETAALIVEPMVQAAGGMIVYPAAYLSGLRDLCTRYGVHFIADEVAVGFGRTGRMFGCEHAGITPDFMCVSKGLTGGLLPLAATLCTDEIYQAFYDDYAALKTFTHGHSYTGNPLTAAAALESIAIFEDEQVLAHVQATAPYLREQAARLTEHPHVGSLRHIGMIAAFDLLEDKAERKAYPSLRRTGFQVYLEGLKEGLLLRPLGDTLYYWLPLCTTKEHIADIVERTSRVLSRLSL